MSRDYSTYIHVSHLGLAPEDTEMVLSLFRKETPSGEQLPEQTLIDNSNLALNYLSDLSKIENPNKTKLFTYTLHYLIGRAYTTLYSYQKKERLLNAAIENFQAALGNDEDEQPFSYYAIYFVSQMSPDIDVQLKYHFFLQIAARLGHIKAKEMVNNAYVSPSHTARIKSLFQPPPLPLPTTANQEMFLCENDSDGLSSLAQIANRL